jgi:hypothetical protein
VEISFPLDEVFATYHIQPDLFIPSHPPETYQLETGDYKLTFRLPDSLDLIKASSATNAVSARLILLEGCLLDASNHGQTVRAVDLPDDVVHILTAHMDEVDPLANVTLPLTCPACSHGWEVIFDIVSFFWAEINAWAERILREVHTLASAYGWREMDILSMSAQRRQKYLELVGA